MIRAVLNTKAVLDKHQMAYEYTYSFWHMTEYLTSLHFIGFNFLFLGPQASTPLIIPSSVAPTPLFTQAPIFSKPPLVTQAPIVVTQTPAIVPTITQPPSSQPTLAPVGSGKSHGYQFKIFNLNMSLPAANSLDCLPSYQKNS